MLVGRYPHKRPAGHQACRPPARAPEVGRITIALESDQVRAEQARDDLPPPGQLREDLITRERNVDEDPDAQVAALFPEHLGHQLKLIVIHPYGRADGCLLRRGPGESPVDPDIGIPPRPAELRRGDHVVIQRPQRGIAEPLVVVADLLSRQPHPDQVHAGDIKRAGPVACRARPADPRTVSLAHDGLQRADQPARAWPPLCAAARTLRPINGKPARDHHEAIITRGPRGVLSHRLGGLVRRRRRARALRPPAAPPCAASAPAPPVLSGRQISAIPARRGNRQLSPEAAERSRLPPAQLTTRQ